MSQDRSDEPGFEHGLDQKPDPPEEEQVGRYSTGHESTPKHDPEKDDVGRYSEGADRLPEHTPEKDNVGTFADSDDPDPARRGS